MNGRLYAGVAGFSYPAWRGGFYTHDARPEDFLRLYAARLPSVELNTTFYRLPADEVFRRWAADTPPDFRFTVKMNRRIVGGDLGFLAPFSERLRALGEKLDAVRVQLPSSRPRDDGFLTLLLGSLDRGLRIAFEADHESWASPEVDRALAGERAVRVNAFATDAPFRYLRLREPPYSASELDALAERISALLVGGIDVYCYFKHEDDPRGALYAERLVEMVRGRI
jgi:uncharacterized protein YecE (DUF72 family)